MQWQIAILLNALTKFIFIECTDKLQFYWMHWQNWFLLNALTHCNFIECIDSTDNLQFHCKHWKQWNNCQFAVFVKPLKQLIIYLGCWYYPCGVHPLTLFFFCFCFFVFFFVCLSFHLRIQFTLLINLQPRWVTKQKLQKHHEEVRDSVPDRKRWNSRNSSN